MAHWLPRKRTILGGTLAMGLIAGIWLSDKLPHMGSGFGLGSGGDGILGKPDVSNVSVQAGDAKTKPDSNNNPDEHVAKLHRTEASPPMDDMLTILVDGRHYAVWRSSSKSNGYYPVELEELVQLAIKAKPNDDGLCVRILRSTTARVTAWQKLQSELVQAGVPAEAIVMPRELVK